ncbi:MAG TPA: hypothetical protein VF755_21530 [Catenuloplanes sp.]|jgi:hypothetical protein
MVPRPAEQPARTGAATTGPLGAGMQRRTFLRTAVIGASALTITALGWVGERLPAFAATRTSRHPRHCMGVSMAGDTACWGRTYISSAWCATDRYHRTDTVNYGTERRRHGWDPACGTYAGWYWTTASGSRVSCWDGHFSDHDSRSGAQLGYGTTSCKRSGG